MPKITIVLPPELVEFKSKIKKIDGRSYIDIDDAIKVVDICSQSLAVQHSPQKYKNACYQCFELSMNGLLMLKLDGEVKESDNGD